MTTKTKLSLLLSNLDPLCINFKVTVKWNGNTIIDNINFDISKLINGNILEFPDKNGAFNIYQLIGNQNLITGDLITILIQQGSKYSNNDNISYSDIKTINFSVVAPSLPSQPSIPTLNCVTKLDLNKTVVNLIIDGIDPECTVYNANASLHNGMGTDISDGINYINSSIPSKPFTLSSDLFFPKEIDLIPGLIITYNISIGINLNQDNPLSTDFEYSNIVIKNYTIEEPTPDTNVITDGLGESTNQLNPKVDVIVDGIDQDLNVILFITVINLINLSYTATLMNRDGLNKTLSINLDETNIAQNPNQSYNGTFSIILDGTNFQPNDSLQIAFEGDDPPKDPPPPIQFISRTQLTTTINKPASIVLDSLNNDSSFNINVPYTVIGNPSNIKLLYLNYTYKIIRDNIEIFTYTIVGNKFKDIRIENPKDWKAGDNFSITINLIGQTNIGSKLIIIDTVSTRFTLTP